MPLIPNVMFSTFLPCHFFCADNWFQISNHIVVESDASKACLTLRKMPHQLQNSGSKTTSIRLPWMWTKNNSPLSAWNLWEYPLHKPGSPLLNTPPDFVRPVWEQIHHNDNNFESRWILAEYLGQASSFKFWFGLDVLQPEVAGGWWHPRLENLVALRRPGSSVQVRSS